MGDDEYGPATAARAKWDFVPEEPSGLALTADDELEVWPTEKGWWFARKKRGGYEGYVPRDYVRVEGRHAEAAFPGISARVAEISPRHEEPAPREDHEDELPGLFEPARYVQTILQLQADTVTGPCPR